MDLLKIARKPPVTLSPNDSVMTAVEKMNAAKVGAVAIVEDGVLVGIFTERDVMNRLVLNKRSALDTQLKDVMTREPMVAPIKMDAREAFESMTDENFRHLPIVDDEGVLLGMLSVRHMMKAIVVHLSHELDGLSAYLGADGIGG